MLTNIGHIIMNTELTYNEFIVYLKSLIEGYWFFLKSESLNKYQYLPDTKQYRYMLESERAQLKLEATQKAEIYISNSTKEIYTLYNSNNPDKIDIICEFIDKIIKSDQRKEKLENDFI